MPQDSIFMKSLKNQHCVRLIDHQELQEARKAAKDANRNAIAALCISIIAIVFSGYLTLKPVSINKADIKALAAAVKGSGDEKSQLSQNTIKIDRLQMAQIISAIEKAKAKPTVKRSQLKTISSEDSMVEAINDYYEQD